MKKIRYFMVAVFASYAALVLAFPYLIAETRHAHLVAGFSSSYMTPRYRKLCVNGGKVVFPTGVSMRNLEFSVVAKGNKSRTVRRPPSGSIDWCVNRYGKNVLFVSWVLGPRGAKARDMILYFMSNSGHARTEVVPLPFPSVFVQDIDVRGSKILNDYRNPYAQQENGLSVFNTKTSSFDFERKSKKFFEAGSFFGNGFTYDEWTRGIVYRRHKIETLIGPPAVPFNPSVNQDRIAWARNSDEKWTIYIYNRLSGKVKKIPGSFPFLTDNGMVFSRERKGVFYWRAGDEIRLVKAGEAYSPIYLNGELYWKEDHANLMFPINEVLYWLGLSDEPGSQQSLIFRKSVHLRHRNNRGTHDATNPGHI